MSVLQPFNLGIHHLFISPFMLSNSSKIQCFFSVRQLKFYFRLPWLCFSTIVTFSFLSLSSTVWLLFLCPWDTAAKIIILAYHSNYLSPPFTFLMNSLHHIQKYLLSSSRLVLTYYLVTVEF